MADKETAETSYLKDLEAKIRAEVEKEEADFKKQVEEAAKAAEKARVDELVASRVRQALAKAPEVFAATKAAEAEAPVKAPTTSTPAPADKPTNAK